MFLASADCANQAAGPTGVGETESSVTFFDKTFEEAFALLVEARNYLAEREQTDAGKLGPGLQLAASCECMRLTARLTQMMAWLLVQKAVHDGEIGEAEAARTEHRLGGHAICATRGAWGQPQLPPRLQRLLDRSHSLYTRVARLDEMVALRHARRNQGGVDRRDDAD